MPRKKNVGKSIDKPAANHTGSAKPPAGGAKKLRERLSSLFTDIENLTGDSKNVAAEKRLRLKSLNTRLHELDSQVRKIDGPDSKPAAGSPGLYDRDQVGFAYSEDGLHQIQDPGGLSNAAPNINVPLTSSGQSIGKVQLAPSPEHPWSPEDTDIVNSVAQQVSLQIESLRLLAETERARNEAEVATRKFMHESWAGYLDAIHQNERIGFSYDQAAVVPFIDKPKPDAGIQQSVNVMDEQVGAVYLTPAADHPLTETDKQMIASIANQIAQQVENIRLLSDASRARAEADDVIRRVTRESWESFTAENDASSIGFAYDSNQVTPFDQTLPKDLSLAIPLQVRGETIGRLAIAGQETLSPEKAELAAAIAEQTSTHLETLRLNEELQKRAAELLELDRLKSGFLANMSHELRTPLNSILGFSDVILEGLDGPLTPTMSSDLQLIQKNGQHLLHLINDVLDMAKIEAGRMNLNIEKIIVHEILEDVTGITSSLATEKDLSLNIEPDSDQAIEIYADRTRLRQVMINLINNSIKFTEKGSIFIRASKKDDQTLLITVKDTGIGIPAEKLELIFQEFTQVDTSTTRKSGGTGLGLPISRRLVTMHGGSLWAESTGVAGEGSTFYVELPLIARITDVD